MPTTPNLTTPDNVNKSQQVYDLVASGTCKDATAELDATHGTQTEATR